MKQCKDLEGKLTSQYIDESGDLYENNNRVLRYHSTNGYEYYSYIIDIDNNKRILLRIDFIMIINFKNIYDYWLYDVIHIDNDIYNYNIKNIEVAPRTEIWKNVLGVNDDINKRYQVSNNGNIRRLDNFHIVKGSKALNGYRETTLINNTRVHYHRLVGYAFIENKNPDLYNTINHIDDNRLNNYDWNLEWVTPRMNTKHASKYGQMGSLSVNEVDMIRDMLYDPIFKGSPKLVYDNIHEKYPNISLKKIYAIKHDSAYQYSDKYDISSKPAFLEYQPERIPTETLDYVRDLLIANDFSPIKVYNVLKYNKSYQNISLSIIRGIKGCCKKTYMRSDKYDLQYITSLFKEHKQNGKGMKKRMDSIINNDNATLDLCRELLLTTTFHGSPILVYEVLNHQKYPNITKNILKHIAYDNCENGSYYRSDTMDLKSFYKKMESKSYNTPSKKLIDKLIASYSSGFSDISDEAYDILLEDYLKKHGESLRPFLRQSQTESIADIVGTLQKSHGVTTPMRPGQITYADWRKKHNFKSLIFAAQPKFDGCSVAYDLKEKRFFTRGDMDNGESVDVTDLFNKHNLNEKNLEGYDAIKFEAILSKQVFNELFSNEYKRPRDVVAAAIHSRDTEVSKYVTLIPLRKIKNKKLYLSDTLKELSLLGVVGTNEYSSIQNFIDDLLANNTSQYFKGQTYECDGVVVSNIGNSNEVLIDEIAIKILNLQKKTKLKKVIFSMGKSGRITPVAEVEPVKFDKVTVHNISLENLNRMTELKLRFGDTVNIMYNIRPYLLSSDHDGDIEIPIPDTCPVCGYKLTRIGPEMVGCENPTCRGNEIGSIVRYCQNMKMYGISTSTIETLYDAGLIKSISDLYHLKVEDISKLDRFGNVSAANIVKSISKASTNVNPLRWLSSLPCRNVGLKTWMMIQKGLFDNDNLRFGNVLKAACKRDYPDIFIEVMCKPVFGVDELTLNAIKTGIKYAWDDIHEMIQYITFAVTTPMKNSKGTVVLSGTRDKTLIEYLESIGYEVSDSFKSDAKYVIIPTLDFVSSKTKKAQAKNIPVISVEQALKLS